MEQFVVVHRHDNARDPRVDTVIAFHATRPAACLEAMARVQANTDEDVTYFSDDYDARDADGNLLYVVDPDDWEVDPPYESRDRAIYGREPQYIGRL